MHCCASVYFNKNEKEREKWDKIGSSSQTGEGLNFLTTLTASEGEEDVKAIITKITDNTHCNPTTLLLSLPNTLFLFLSHCVCLVHKRSTHSLYRGIYAVSYYTIIKQQQQQAKT